MPLEQFYKIRKIIKSRVSTELSFKIRATSSATSNSPASIRFHEIKQTIAFPSLETLKHSSYEVNRGPQLFPTKEQGTHFGFTTDNSFGRPTSENHYRIRNITAGKWYTSVKTWSGPAFLFARFARLYVCIYIYIYVVHAWTSVRYERSANWEHKQPVQFHSITIKPFFVLYTLWWTADGSPGLSGCGVQTPWRLYSNPLFLSSRSINRYVTRD